MGTPSGTPVPTQPVIRTAADLLAGPAPRELILLAGKDGVGKTSAVMSMAKLAELGIAAPGRANTPFYVIDTENKFPTIYRTWGADAPANVVYYPAEDMNEVLLALEHIVARRRVGEWIAVESMARIWEYAQDLGYLAEAGVTKLDYLERRRQVAGSKVPPPVPHPDRFWQTVKNAHDAAFLDVLKGRAGLNVILTTTVSKPPRENTGRRENESRKEYRLETGVDVGMDGAPRLPGYVETTCLLDRVRGVVRCQVLRDNPGMAEDSRPTFDVPDKREWAPTFWEKCRIL